MERQLRYFILAAEEDPLFADAWAGIASAYTLASGVGIPFTNGTTAWRAPAEKAVRLDPESMLANLTLGMGCMIMERDWSSAERHLRKALQLDPDGALANNAFGNYLYGRGDLRRALEYGRRATELEPTALFWWFDLAWFQNANGHYQESLASADAGLELVKSQSALGRNQKGWSYLLLKQHAQAIGEFQAAIGLEPGNPFFHYGLGCVLADSSRQVLARLESMRKEGVVSRFFTAGVLLGLGEREKALADLEQGQREDDPCFWWLAGDPWYAPLRDEPRSMAILGDAVRR